MTESKEPWEIWNEVLVRVSESGLDGVDDRERIIFLVNRLLCDFENGGYSGFLYNICPPDSSAWTDLRATADAVSELGDDVTAELLRETASVLEATDGGAHSTWGQ